MGYNEKKDDKGGDKGFEKDPEKGVDAPLLIIPQTPIGQPWKRSLSRYLIL